MARTRSINFDSWLRAQDSIAQGALTNSKRPQTFVEGVYPTHVKGGNACFLYDTAGNKYIDFICGLGTNIIGYGHPAVTHAITKQATQGCTFSLGSEVELDLAEKLKEILPFVSRVKFLKSGSEACSAAIRIARAKTGRNTVLSEGYHGWHDPFVSLTPPAIGVPAQVGIWHFKGLDQITTETAAVIVEPIQTDFSEERRQFLYQLREKCTQTGALLIFDEIITGFRFPKFSVSTYYGITPDLICLGKAIANGMPLSVVGGSDAVMNCGEYFVSSTFAGETVSMAAAMTVIEILQKKYSLDELWEQGERFQKRFNILYPEKIMIQGYPTRGVFVGDPMTKALLFQEACLAGILLGPSFFFNFNHAGYSDIVLQTLEDILTKIKQGSIALKGKMPQSPFAQRVRDAR